VLSNELAYGRWDSYPVSKGHMLLVPYRHVSDYFESSSTEKSALWELLGHAREIINEEHRPDGFNVGINIGKVAGQTIFHLHVHVIPRYAGDVADPKGGVRGVIPAKRRY
jgi:diadenosine tetraphosphate (Ap4A) HIT family hydrolase